MKGWVFEFWPPISQAGRTYFGLNDIPRLETIAQDAKTYVNQTQLRFDMIELDVFQGGLFVPFYLMSYEFFSELKKILTKGGILAINIYNPKRDGKAKFIQRVQNTVAKVFPSLFYMDFNEHRILYASMRDYTLEEFRELARKVDAPQEFKSIMSQFPLQVHKTAFNPEEEIFSDDLAPVESLIYKMITSK